MKKYLLRSPRLVETLYRWRARGGLLHNHPQSEITILRQYLRICPNWLAGHQRLGLAALRAIERSPRDQAQRMLATAELSAEAIYVLDGGQENSSDNLALKVIQCGVLFFKKEYAECLVQAEALLSTTQDVLCDELRLQLFEQAGAAAMSLGMREKAAFYFSAIPEELRTAQGVAALGYLSSKEQGDV